MLQIVCIIKILYLVVVCSNDCSISALILYFFISWLYVLKCMSTLPIFSQKFTILVNLLFQIFNISWTSSLKSYWSFYSHCTEFIEKNGSHLYNIEYSHPRILPIFSLFSISFFALQQMLVLFTCTSHILVKFNVYIYCISWFVYLWVVNWLAN